MLTHLSLFSAQRTETGAREIFSVGNRIDVPGEYWTANKPPVCGMADGVPGGVDGRMKHRAVMTALGNAVVPQQFYPIFKAIFDYMSMEGYCATDTQGII